MSQRTASLNLEWEHPASGDWMADLPAIPGYTGTTGNYSFVTVGPSPTSEDWVCSFTIFVPGKGQAYLSNRDLGIPDAVTGEEMVAAVDALSPEDIADALQAEGYAPVDATASRHASRRIASLDLDWEEDETARGDTMYVAALPEIPGYPYSGNSNSTVLLVPSTFNPGEYLWFMDIRVSEDTTVRLSDYELTGMGSYPLDYQMGYLDGLSVEWIAGKLAEKGYMPDED